MKQLFYGLIISLGLITCKGLPEIETSSEAVIDFNAKTNNKVLVSAHRGGKDLENYPENCIETMEMLHQEGVEIFEVDVTEILDGTLVLMHDASLNRTTTAEGKITNYTLKDLKNIKLTDNFGTPTSYEIPTLKEAALWAKENGTFLMVDIKRGTSYKKIVETIRDAGAEKNCALIAYNVNQSLKMYAIAPELKLSVPMRNEREFEEMIRTNIPSENMIAFTGTRASSEELYQKIKNKGIMVILGTLGNLDKRAAARGNRIYEEFIEQGVQIFATDRPLEVQQLIQKQLP